MGRDELLQLAHDGRVSPRRQIRLDAPLQRGQPHLRQAGGFPPYEAVVSEILQNRPAPQLQRPTQGPSRVHAVAGVQLRPPVPDRRLETSGVRRGGIDPQQISVPLGHQHLGRGAAGPRRLQDLAQVEDVRLHRGDHAVRRVVAPHLFDETVQGDDPVRLDQQQGQDRALPRTAQRQRGAGTQHPQRPEKAELRGRPR